MRSARQTSPRRSADGRRRRGPAAFSPGAPAPIALIGGRRERNKAKNREEILSAACRVFTDLGYGAATVRDIVRRTDLASGTFYNYFPDKESVFRALLGGAQERLNRWMNAATVRRSSLDDYVHDRFHAYFSFVAADRAMFDLMRRNAGTIRALSDDPRFTADLAELRGEIGRAIGRGDVPRVDADYLASAIWGTSFEIGVIMVERNPVDVEGATEFATTLFAGAYERAARLTKRVGKGRAK